VLLICTWPVVETNCLFRCSLLWGLYIVQQNLSPERTKAAAILQNLVSLKPRCLMLIIEAQGHIAKVHYMHPSLTVGTKGGCSRNCQQPLAWYKHCPVFPLSIALIVHNSPKPLSLFTSTCTRCSHPEGRHSIFLPQCWNRATRFSKNAIVATTAAVRTWNVIVQLFVILKCTLGSVFTLPQLSLLKNHIYIYIYTGCPRRNVPDFGRVFLMRNYTDITQNT